MEWPCESVALALSVVLPAEATTVGLAEAVTVSVCGEDAGATVTVVEALAEIHGATHAQVAVTVSVTVRLVVLVFAGAVYVGFRDVVEEKAPPAPPSDQA